MYFYIIVNASTLLLSSSITAINRVPYLREKVQRYLNPKRKGPKSIQIEEAVDNSSSVYLAHNNCQLGSQSASQTQNHQGNDCSRWLPVFATLMIITMLELASTKHAHAHTHKQIIKIILSMLNVHAEEYYNNDAVLIPLLIVTGKSGIASW